MQENNSLGKGMMLTWANDVIGTGPRLQITTDDLTINKQIEIAFKKWALKVKLAQKLRTAIYSKRVDGEVFIWKTTNKNLRHPIKLDVRLIEGDQVSTPMMQMLFESNAVDGVRYDNYGNPIEYHVLKQHPGSQLYSFLVNPLEYDRVPADQIIHLFREDRPGQRRGMSEVASALPLFGMLRRYTLAVMHAAETAADFAGVMYTDGPAVDPDEVEPMDAIELEMKAMLTLPRGWKLGQMKAEQPATTYDMFKRAIIQEIARCVNMPYNIAAGDSSSYNYASGRLDHQTYFRAVGIERSVIENELLNDIFEEWLDEALLIDGYLKIPALENLSHTWQWDGFEHVDPLKEAEAGIRLVNAGLLTHADYHSSQGRDWEEVFEQRARENQRAESLGLSETPDAQSKQTSQTTKFDEDD
jgi:lambda family phage portal protein